MATTVLAANNLHIDLVPEILTWLPVKSLVRFKAVSKLWQSIILHPSFARKHRGGFRGLLLTFPDPLPWGYLKPPRDFVFLKLDGASGQLSLPLSLGMALRITEAVNGLVCFYRGNDLSVCNIATREIAKLPISNPSCKFPTYHFGFDRVNYLYKLLKICPVYEEEEEEQEPVYYSFVRNLECEILTLGVDSSWRSIDPAPVFIRNQSICINGVLHWIDERLIAFHLADEKFQEIPRPDHDLGLPDFGTTSDLLLLGSFSKPGSDGFTISHYRLGKWTKPQDFNFPDELRDAELHPVGKLPDGRLVLANYELRSPAPLCLFDETNGTFEKIVITQSSDSPSFMKISYYEENIISLSCLLGATRK